MSTRTSYDHGTPSWVDLTTPDVDAAKAFYGGLFGWDAEDQFDDGQFVYTMLRRGVQNVAGLGPQMEGMEGMPAIWMSYVAVDSVDEVVKKAEAAGGTVMMAPMDVMDGVGRMAFFSDPTGAAIGVWEAGTHIGADVVNEPNTYSWNELLTRDLDTAKAFYTEVFGWQYDVQDMGDMGEYSVIRGGEEGGLGGMMAMPPMVPDEVPNYWGVYFTVEDADATAAKAQELGGQVMVPAMDAPGVGRMIGLLDPHGGMFTLMQPESQD